VAFYFFCGKKETKKLPQNDKQPVLGSSYIGHLYYCKLIIYKLLQFSMIVVLNYCATKLIKSLPAFIHPNYKSCFSFLIPAGYSPSCNKILYQLSIAGGAQFRIFYHYAAPQYYRHFLQYLNDVLLLPPFYF
jgi:hypothetical protein